MKFKFNYFGTKVNHFNLTSPYKPVKNETLEIHNSFLDKDNNYHLLNSPLIGTGNNGKCIYLFISIDLLFHEMESTNYYSNFTTNTW